jgi:hypothetical protein
MLTAFVLLSLLVTACGPAPPVKSVAVTAHFESDSILSGGSTILVVGATNNGTLAVNGTFRIRPENDHVTAETRPDVLPVEVQESAGQKRYNLSARAQSTSETIKITVDFLDATTHEVLGTTPVLLSVHK